MLSIPKLSLGRLSALRQVLPPPLTALKLLERLAMAEQAPMRIPVFQDNSGGGAPVTKEITLFWEGNEIEIESVSFVPDAVTTDGHTFGVKNGTVSIVPAATVNTADVGTLVEGDVDAAESTIGANSRIHAEIVSPATGVIEGVLLVTFARVKFGVTPLRSSP